MPTNVPAAAPKRRSSSKAAPETTPTLDLRGTKMERLQQLYGLWYGCQKCPLGQNRALTGLQDIVFGEGNPDAHVMIIGEAPGEEEERTNIPFVGAAGELLNQLLAQTSDDPAIQQWVEWYVKVAHTDKNRKDFHKQVTEWRHKEFFLTNAVSCHPPENATPNNEMVKTCWERLWNTIYIVDPLLIVVSGNTALSAVMRKAQVKITAERGKLFDVSFPGRVGKVVYPVMPVFHTSYLLRKADWRVKGGDWQKSVDDWKRVMRVLDFLRNKHFGVPIPDRKFKREVMFV
jgi:uracil-DNA glycosylase family 4